MMSSAAASSFFRNHPSSEAAIVVSKNPSHGGEDLQLDALIDLDDDGGAAKNPILRFFETKMNIMAHNATNGGKCQTTDTELEEMEEPTVKIVAPDSKPDFVGGFDICREYNYFVDDDDESSKAKNRSLKAVTPDSTSFFGSSFGLASSATASFEEAAEEGSLHTYVLGKTYHPIHDYTARRGDESSLFWFTYRCDFPEIKPYGICSDAGWGCMLRSAQMLLGQVLRVHYKSRDWRPPQTLSRQRQDPFLRSVLTWFADFPSTSDCVYSLHNMVASGLANYDKLPGEWYGPGTACYVLRDLVEMHERQQLQERQPSSEGRTEKDCKFLRVHVASNGTVYRDEIRKLTTRDKQARLDEEKKKREAERPPPEHPLDHSSWDEELVEAAGVAEWDSALLLLIPLRLGLKSFNPDYVGAVAHTFSFPQSVGVLGGRPRGARWFYGALSDGSKIFGLDPHTVQSAPRRRTARVNGVASSVVDLSDEYLRSVQTTYPEVFSLLRMDPSIALGFYCRTEMDFENLIARMQSWKKEHPESPELFSVADASPDYSANISSSMNDMLMCSTAGSVLDGDHEQSDDDEYVML